MLRYFACENQDCLVLIYAARTDDKVPHCPCCWYGGQRLDEGTIDDLIRALDKNINPQRERLFIP